MTMAPDTCCTLPTDYPYYAYPESTCTSYSWWPDTASEEIAKEARRRWLLFTRGLGWAVPSPVRWVAVMPLRLWARVLPGLRLTRRAPRRFRLHTLKQLRRMLDR